MRIKKKSNLKGFRVLAALAIIAVTGANTSEAFAQSMEKLHVEASNVNVYTLKEYRFNKGNYYTEIKVPKLEGLDNKKLQDSLNAKYLEEDKKLYEKFMKDVKDMEKAGGGHLAVNSGYEILTNNDTIFSIKRYVETIQASSDVENKFDTIDKKNQVLITLPSLFKDESYVDAISNEIIRQMKEKVKLDPSKAYWLDNGVTMPEDVFKKINKEQSFYINKDGKLVISFNKYDVAPGYMGTPEFVIPTEVISKLLVSKDYIK